MGKKAEVLVEGVGLASDELLVLHKKEVLLNDLVGQELVRILAQRCRLVVASGGPAARLPCLQLQRLHG